MGAAGIEGDSCKKDRADFAQHQKVALTENWKERAGS